MRKQGTVNMTVYYPQTSAGQDDLARRVAEAHASAVIGRIDRLSCASEQKLHLLDAIIAAGTYER